MASNEDIKLSEEHPPTARAITAFKTIEGSIKNHMIKLRRDWNKHEPRMWAATEGLSDEELTNWTAEKDLVGTRAGAVAYGVIIFGRIRIPALSKSGYVFVRIFDPSDEAKSDRDVEFHSIFTNEIRNPATAHEVGKENDIIDYRAIQTDEDKLEFFNE
ncbi:vacuolar protein sorting/targeting protein PEP1 [Tilletia horrida]|uniref:Vacuolar protein sorting/targeting protein PEP1 n=1 Tax=Tilletia horrida TaxID=155126 RepID=A0AAN6JS71_9BASI|nr:vacuolar protein sorting/targeting protein PEP1 [Tilletia horrida]KAK0552997.1 vacuolar protein sorting/targeting protein PEP1 [Tilletia horrida]KAK0566883.1 vacuolar protein sorting/targeting protein PEP1 [Tilletia horrida]